MLLEIYIIFLSLKQDIPFLKNSFFLSTIIEWNKLDHNIRNSSSFNIFRKNILKFIRPSDNSFFNCHTPKGIKFVTRLRLGLSHLREHKFKHSFQDFLNPFRSCGLDIKSTAHFLLHCPTYITSAKKFSVKFFDISVKYFGQIFHSKTQFFFLDFTT